MGLIDNQKRKKGGGGGLLNRLGIETPSKKYKSMAYTTTLEEDDSEEQQQILKSIMDKPSSTPGFFQSPKTFMDRKQEDPIAKAFEKQRLEKQAKQNEENYIKEKYNSELVQPIKANDFWKHKISNTLNGSKKETLAMLPEERNKLGWYAKLLVPEMTQDQIDKANTDKMAELKSKHADELKKLTSKIGSFTSGAVDTATLGLARYTDDEMLRKKYLQDSGFDISKKANPGLYTAGNFAGYIAPGTVAEKGVGSLIKGTGLISKIGRGAVAGAGMEGVEGGIRQETPSQIAKRMAVGAVAGGVGEGLIHGTGKIIEKAKAPKQLENKLTDALGESLTKANQSIKLGESVSMKPIQHEKLSGIKTQKITGSLPQENIPLKVGDKVKTKDKGNIGTIIYHNEESNQYSVIFKNKKAGTEKVVKYTPNNIESLIKTKKLNNFDNSTNTEPLIANDVKPALNEVAATNNDLDGLKQRSFGNTVKTGDIANKTIQEIFETPTYKELRNKDVLEFAKKFVDDNPEEAIRIVKSPGNSSAEANTIAQVLIKKAQDEGRYHEAIDLIESVSKKATEQGQAIQALSMWGRLTPDGMLKHAQRIFDKANASNPKLKLKLNDELVDFITKNMNEINQMAEGRAKIVKTQKVLTKIEEHIPPTLGQKISTVQTIAQLLNPKTFIRNIGGNLGFSGLENIKDVVAAGVDKGVSLVTKNRTKTLPNFKTQAKGFKEGWKLGAEDVREGINTAETKTQFDLPQRKMFKSKVGKGVEKVLDYSLKVPDRAFYKSAYDESLRQQMKAAKVLAPTKAMEESAHYDALYRTFQDENAVSKAFQGLKKVLNVGKEFGLGDLVLKYPKTPANLLMRSIDYSPAGFIKSTLEMAKPLVGKSFNQKTFVESVSRALVGTTGLVGTGALLHRLGIITGKREKDSEAASLLQEVGIGGYKFNTSALKRLVMSGFNPEAAKMQEGDNLVSYDWLQPMAVGLAVGANISANKMKDSTAEEMGTLDNVISSVVEGSNTLAEQSLLRNLTDLFKGNQKPMQVVANLIQQAPSTFIPTFVNQIRQLTDNTKRDVSSNNFGKGMWNQTVNKIPFASKTLEPRISTTGQEQQSYQKNSLFNVFLNPAFTSKYKPTPAAKMVIDLFTQTGETKQFPRFVEGSFVSNKTKVVLTSQEKATLQKEVGKKTIDLLNGLTKDQVFMKSSPENQIETIYKKLQEAGEYGKNIIKKQKGLPIK